MGKRKLEWMREKWFQEYLRCWDATEAAIRAGYSSKSAKNQGYRLMTSDDFKSRIEEMVAKIKEREREKTLSFFELAEKRLRAVLEFDPIHAFRADSSGVDLKTWKEMSESTRLAFESVNENESQFGTSRSMKSRCPFKAIDMAIKLGLLKPKAEDDETKQDSARYVDQLLVERIHRALRRIEQSEREEEAVNS